MKIITFLCALGTLAAAAVLPAHAAVELTLVSGVSGAPAATYTDGGSGIVSTGFLPNAAGSGINFSVEAAAGFPWIGSVDKTSPLIDLQSMAVSGTGTLTLVISDNGGGTGFGPANIGSALLQIQ